MRYWRRFLEYYDKNFSNPKIVKQGDLESVLAEVRNGKIVVSTNGCFDILHPGHIKFLENAKAQGDILIVALNSDKSVKTIKGEDRPIINQELRAYALSALNFTDYITIFDETTPEQVLKIIKPDIHVKGAEYKESGIPEQKVVESLGGKVVYLPLVEGFSSTRLINEITRNQR